MKKLFISMAALLAIVSCSKNEVAEIPTDFADDLTFKATFEESDSRVSISEEEGGFKLAWSDDDEIAIYTRINKTKYAYDPSTQVFTKSSNNVGAALEDYYYSVYPYTAASQSINSGKLSLDMPPRQTYAENSFGKGANTMVAICPKPTVVSSEPVQLQFRNVAGYLRLYLYGDNITVKSIELMGNKGEILAGQANTTITENDAPELTWVSTSGQAILLNCGDGVKVGSSAEEATAFWLVVPPTHFEEGFKIRVTDVEGKVMQKSLDKSFDIVRNTVETMEPLAVEFPEVDSNLILDVQFNEDGTATDNGKYYMDIKAHPGAGMTTITDEDYPYGKVVKFTNCDGKKNAQLTDSFYGIDYSNTIGFKNDLSDEDGFTLEMVVKHGIQSRSDQHPWQNPATSNTFGLFMKGTDNGGNAGWIASRQCTEEHGDNSSPFTDADNMKFSPCLNQYYHYLYVYDKANNKVIMYCDGEFINEHKDVKPIAAGNRFAIGGFPTSTNVIEHSFTGCVALVRMYDAAMTAEEARSSYKDLNIPSKVAPVGEPLFDAKFNEDGTAENVGTADITIETVANADVLTTVQRGTQYVANFYRASKDNKKSANGFYYVNYGDNADYISKLNNGFTMEVVCKVKNYSGDYWSKAFSSSTAGIHHNMVENNNGVWGMYGNTPVDNWGTGIGWGHPNNWSWTGHLVSLQSYEHLVLVWNAESNVFTFYVNGKYGSSYTSVREINVGTLLAIGGLPCTDKTVYHPFVGEIAVARVYDETMSMQQAMERFEELKPTIETLNAASNETMEAPKAGNNHKW